ncbi:hypothetical protein A5662_24520 [Mycobacteriaceae bacterium 1482268.1]|nr:hypothetical protein A5662_24520 [Mycobacteriaceae bacterium 1482268.1]
MKRVGWTALVLLGLITPLTEGCVRTDEGVAIRSQDSARPTNAQAPTTPSSDDSGPAAPGVVATTRAPIPADSVTCAPSSVPVPRFTLQAVDPQAPRVTVALPDGWAGKPTDDRGARVEGPNGMSATITITQTSLEPAEAFTEYADKAMAVSAVSSVSVLPAELCGYSGQKLMGAWSDSPQQSVEFLDRIAHIWTNTGNYLVAIHVQAPSGTDGFDAAAAVLTGDVAVEIP